MQRRSLALALPALALGAATRCLAASEADTTRRYVALSLVSDQLVWVGAPAGVTGTHLVHGEARPVSMRNAAFDHTVLEVLAGEVPRLDARARLSFLASSAPEAYAAQQDWFSAGRLALPAPLQAAVVQEGASRLLLLTKARGDAHVADGHDSRGMGKLSGLGFYTDDNQPMVDAGSGDQSTGFVAPYVYVTLSLVDLQTFAVLRQSGVQAAKPYRQMSPQGLLDALQGLLVDNVRRATREVMQGA